MAGAPRRARRSGPLFGYGDRDRLDAAADVSSPIASDRGFMESIFALLGVTVSAPDHSTLSRRATTLPSVSWRMPDGPLHVLIDSTGLKVYGAGEWLQEKHGARARRSWRKLHLAVDAASGMIVAQTLTEKEMETRPKWAAA